MKRSQQMITACKASHQGSKHIQQGFNNQDGMLLERFSIPKSGKHYVVGFVSDGCTGMPGMSKTEVGASLLPVFAYARIQEYICAGIPIVQLPTVLFQSCTEFIRDLANKVMPPSVHWGYSPEVTAFLTSKKNERVEWGSNTRFRIDYLASTLLGFVSDGEELVVFSAGDGVIMINDTITVIDQNDQPEYPAVSINNPGVGFAIQSFRVSDVQRLVIASDGLKKLMEEESFVSDVFAGMSFLSLQTLLNKRFKATPEKMTDDCTAIAVTFIALPETASSLETTTGG